MYKKSSGKGEFDVQQSSTNSSSGNNRREKPLCQICNKQGHIAFNFFVLRDILSGKAPSQFPSKTLTSHVASNDVVLLTGYTWLLDSSASHHLTSKVASMVNSIPHNGSEGVVLGNGNKLHILIISYNTLISNNKCALNLSNFLYTPFSTTNLLYV